MAGHPACVEHVKALAHQGRPNRFCSCHPRPAMEPKSHLLFPPPGPLRLQSPRHTPGIIRHDRDFLSLNPCDASFLVLLVLPGLPGFERTGQGFASCCAGKLNTWTACCVHYRINLLSADSEPSNVDLHVKNVNKTQAMSQQQQEADICWEPPCEGMASPKPVLGHPMSSL